MAGRAVCLGLGLGLLCACSSGWTLATDSLDRVALSVSDGVWVVGGGQGNGAPSLVKRLSGSTWADVGGVDGDETLWWASNEFIVGERGAIYRRAEPLERLSSPVTNATLFGVWGEWAVGGSPTSSGEDDVLLKWDGAAWTRVAPPSALGVAYFKVWGRAANDVWVVGEQGVTLHWDGAAWMRVMTPTRSTLLTVSGSASEVWAVGGPPAVLLRWDGSEWQNEELPFKASGLTGVSVAPNGDVFVVGLAGVRWRRVNGTWHDDSESPALGDLHAVWVGSSEAWAVGGNYIATDPSTKRRGLVARYGQGAAPALK